MLYHLSKPFNFGVLILNNGRVALLNLLDLEEIGGQVVLLLSAHALDQLGLTGDQLGLTGNLLLAKLPLGVQLGQLLYFGIHLQR
jgi:hypothetical protein